VSQHCGPRGGTCIRSWETVKAAAPSITSLSITCLHRSHTAVQAKECIAVQAKEQLGQGGPPDESIPDAGPDDAPLPVRRLAHHEGEVQLVAYLQHI
jgi:hypothetical protein